MARKKNNGQGAGPINPEGATAGHNVGVRADVIRAACRDITALEAQRKKISEGIRSIKQTRIKGDLGMKIGDFNAALRLYQLEGDARAQLLATVRETFEALGCGEQLDWLKASEIASANRPSQEDEEAARAQEEAAASGQAH